MNRRTFLNSILSNLLYITHRQLSAAEALVKKNSAFVKVENLEKNNTTIMVDPVFLEHHIGPTHPESPSRIQHIERALIESNLFEGRQDIPKDLSTLAYGISITDECISWETTQRMIKSASTSLK